MTDKRLDQLTALSALADNDLLYVVDVSDTTDGSNGTSKKITPDKLNGGEGNVLRWGADPTGVTDSTAAFQSAQQTGVPYIPYGDYRIDGTVTCDEETIWTFQRGMLPNVRFWDNAAQAPFDSTPGRRVRLFKDNTSSNVPFFKVRWSGVFFNGFPLLDVSERDSFTSSGILYAVNETNPENSQGRVRIWSGGAQVLGLGNIDSITDAGEGMNVIYVDWSSPEVLNGYVTDCDWVVYAQYCNRAFYSTEITSGSGQFANGSRLVARCDGCKQAAVWDAFSEGRLDVRYQARFVNDVSESGNAVVDLISSRNRLDLIAYDLTATPDANSHYKLNKSFDNTGIHNQIRSESPASIYKGTNNEETYTHDRLIAPAGYVARMRVHSFDQPRPAAVSDLHNYLIAANKRFTTVIDAYDGTSVADFSTLTNDSVTESIPTSSDITLTGTDSLFAPFIDSAETKFTWNSTAVTDNDYVEVHIDMLNASHDLSALFLCLDIDRNAPTQIQVITRDASSVVNNTIKTVKLPTPSLTPNRVFSFDLGTNIQHIIVRFIGCDLADDSVTILDFAAFLSGTQDYRPYIHTYGGQTIYGDLTISDGSWNGDGLLRLGDYRLWVDSTGDLRIKSGAPTGDTDGTIVGTQS